MITLDFQNKHVMVVGGTSGINRGIAESFARHGAKVSVASRSEDKVNDTVARLRAAGAPDTAGFISDVRDYATLAEGIESTSQALGAIDVLVAGAAGNFPALANKMSANAFKSVVDIDVLGTFNTLHAAFDYLNKPGASVITISAPQSVVPMVGQSHVCAAKAGVDMLIKTLAMEWAGAGVRVNGVSPGPVDGTEGMARLAPNPQAMDACRRSVPLQRLGAPQDIANTCHFLASDLASYVTGCVIATDGGWSLAGTAAVGASMAAVLQGET